MALAASTLRTISYAQAPDRRRFHRVNLALGGRLMDRHGREFDCRSADVSPGGARLAANAAPALGDEMVLYLADLGRLSGTIARIDADSQFAVSFDVSVHKREKLAEQLTWLLNKSLFAGEEERRATRHTAASGVSVSLENGAAIFCEVRDFSLVGCSLKTNFARPDLGAWVRVGQSYGRVSRYLEDGFAVDFQAVPHR